MEKVLVVDVDKCTGCKVCEMVCSLHHEKEVNPIKSRIHVISWEDEGVDIPSTKVAFFLASTTNPKEFIQRRGRVLRRAEGKAKAILYDFVVVPNTRLPAVTQGIDTGLLRREMPRFAEFSFAAMNKFESRSVLLDLLNQYGLLHLLDERPVDIYQSVASDMPVSGTEEGAL